MGIASRSLAAEWVRQGRVSVNGKLVCDPEFPVRQGLDHIEVAGQPGHAQAHVAIMLNKPRGLLTTVADEKGRETVYACLKDSGLPWLAPVGRLDKASEGLLLFSNNPEWAASITSPESGPPKTYHVQVDCIPDDSVLAAIAVGSTVDGEHLGARSVQLLRHGAKHAWLQIVLEEGRNRQIRRLLQAHHIGVLRLVRVAVGRLSLGDLGKGKWRSLTLSEIDALASPAPR